MAVVGDIPSVRRDVGMFAKDVALDELRRDSGSDLVLSGFRRRSARLSAGYEIEGPTSVVLSMRPAGLVTLLSSGRRTVRDRIAPRRRRSGPVSSALNTPWGPRRSVRGSTAPGKGTIRDVERTLEARVVDVALKSIGKVIDKRM